MAEPRIEIFCLTYGEPPENFWRQQYDYSLSILNRLTLRVAPIPRYVTPLLAARRGLIRARDFSREGYHSPLEPISRAQAEKIGQILRRKRPGYDFRSRMVMEFRPPYIHEHLRELQADPPAELVLLPLYVAESDFTTGISRTDLADYQRRTRGAHGLPKPAYVGGFGFEPRMGRVMADHILRHCKDAGWSDEKMRDSALVLGAHGTLQYPPEGVNSGARETLYLFGLVRTCLKDRFRTVRVGWLNHTLGGKWTFPAVDEAAKELQDQSIRRVVYFPFGFMGDNNESQREGRDALAEFTWDDLLYLPCPNDEDAFCELLADMVLERLDQPEREDWNAIEQGGRRDLIQPVRPAVPGKPGLLRFNGPTLGAMAIVFWLMVGCLLIARGFTVVSQVHSVLALSLVAVFTFLVGYFKGSQILAGVMRKNLARLRRLPQPSPVYMMFSKLTWQLILFFSLLGISLRFIGLPPAVYAVILLGVGVSLLYGGVVGILNWRESIPREIISMHHPAPRPRRVMSQEAHEAPSKA